MFQTRLYTKELLDYLHTVTIKNDIIADHMLDTWVKDEYRHLIDRYPSLHPYYRNITGNYILRNLSDVEPLLDIDRNKLSISEYRQLQPHIVNEANMRFGLSDRVMLSEGLFLNRNIYTKFNDLVILNSMDTQESIPLTKQILYGLSHVKTIASYKIPNNSYYTLCERYPNSASIIKGILYPISDDIDISDDLISGLMTLDNFALLGGDHSLLEDSERDSMLECLNDMLSYIRVRWGVKEFKFEDLYPAAHDAVIWNILFLALHVQRIKNIRTYSVHSYHIWEYMKSHGFDNYEDVLTRKQALFLYKNLRYLLKHKGTEKVLELLSYVLLDTWNIRLDNKIHIQQLENKPEGKTIKRDTTPAPGFVSKRVGEKMFNRLTELMSSHYTIGKTTTQLPFQNILTELEKVAGKDDGDIGNLNDIGTYESVETLLNKERISGLEYQDDVGFARSLHTQNKQLSITPHNALKTKLLELNSPPASLVFETLYVRFITQQILYLASVNALKFAVSLLPDYSESFITLTANETIALLLYTIAKEYGFTIESPPKLASITIAYRTDYNLRELRQELPIRELPTNIIQILKPLPNAYGIRIDNYPTINGIYLPTKDTSIWVCDESYSGSKIKLEYVRKKNRWEFNRGSRLLAYSNKIKYYTPNTFNIDTPWQFPRYWYNVNKQRVVLNTTVVLNPTVDKHYAIVNSLNILSRPYTSVEDFSSNVHKQGEGFVSMMAEADQTASNNYHSFIHDLKFINVEANKTGVCANRTVELDLLNGKSYKEFFSENPELRNVIDHVNLSDDIVTTYAGLSDKIIRALYPVDSSLNVESSYATNYRYKKLKELFISMCSYNVAFLETKNKTYVPYTMRTTVADVVKATVSQTTRAALVGDTKYKAKYSPIWNDLNGMVVVDYL